MHGRSRHGARSRRPRSSAGISPGRGPGPAEVQAMPFLERPDGARIWWEQRGDGPGVLVCNTFNLGPVDELLDRLAAERRALTYAPRGIGRSSHDGPYDLDTGVADLIALLEETGPVEVA